MPKTTVYIETTIAGHLTSRLPKAPLVAGQMLATRDWWARERQQFDCYTSQVVLDEAGSGDPQAAAERLAILAELPILESSLSADALAESLLRQAALPMKARIDAIHVAIAATMGMSFLLTWNCKHLANAAMRTKIEKTCRDSGYDPPIICTPLELPQEQT